MSNCEIKMSNDETVEMKKHPLYCDGFLYEKDRVEITTGTLITIRCNKCGFYDYIKVPVDFSNKDDTTS